MNSYYWSLIKNNFLNILFAVFFLICALWPVSQNAKIQEVARAKVYLENELHSLKNIPGAVYQPLMVSSKDYSLLWIYSRFESKMDLSAVINYYDTQLKMHGWTRGKGGRLWGNDDYATYSKGPYTIDIEKHPQDPNPNVYELRLRWHGSNPMDMVVFVVMLYVVGNIIYHFIRWLIYRKN